MNKIKTCIQAIHYLLTQLGETDKLKIVKLMFLADKLHLISYGRTITGDKFFAMRKGPVGSTVSDVLTYAATCDDEFFVADDSDCDYCVKNLIPSEHYIPSENRREHRYNAQKNELEYEYLSDSDKEVLDEVIQKFGMKKSGELVELVHLYPEWKKHEEALKEGTLKRGYIHLAEMFSTIPNDPLGIPPEIVQDSKELFLGC